MGKRTGFTIVELLIVIVVIAILAAITIVAYNGIQARARVSSVSSALSQAKKKIAVWQFDNPNTSPADLATVGVTNSGDVSYQYTAGSNGSYCITATNGTTSYKISESTTPTAGGCAGHGQGGVAAITNLGTNPSGESALGWLTNNATTYPASWDTSVKRTGSRSRSASNTNGALILLSLYSVGGDTGAGTGIPITQSGQYTFSVYFRADVPHQAYLRVGYRLSGVFTGLNGPYVTGTAGAWTQGTYTFTIPAGADMLRPVVDVQSLSAQPIGTKAWVDDAIITYGGNTYSYADGDSADWVWNGTTGASSSTRPPL